MSKLYKYMSADLQDRRTNLCVKTTRYRLRGSVAGEATE